MLSRARLVCSLGILLCAQAVACSEPEAITADTSSSDLIGRVPGATINSPNANPAATYLSARGIGTLEAVNALPGVLASLAHRVDGIIANQPADGRVSVQELLQIEKPGFVETLFPEEKAALPEIWKLLETTNAAPTAVTLPALVSLSAVDVSTPFGPPSEPAKLDIASLPSALQLSAKRLELTQDSDADKTTVTKADLATAIATPGPYTPAEIADFNAILQVFLERAGTALSARVQVADPVSTTTSLATWGPASLGFFQSIDYTETRQLTLFNRSTDGALYVSIQSHLVQKAVVTLPGNQQLVILDETSEKEAVVGNGPLESTGGPSTIEVWSGGARVGSFHATLPALTSVETRSDLGTYADYAFVTAGGAALSRNVVSATWSSSFGSRSQSASFAYETMSKPTPAGADASALSAVATPRLNVAPGRYEIDVPQVGKMDIDLYPEGVMKVTRPGGATTRAPLYVWTYAKFSAEFPDRLRALYDANTNAMMIFFDGHGVLFQGPLTGAMRKG